MALSRRTLTSPTATTGTGSATSISVTPTGQQENDWVIIWVCSAGGADTHSNTAGGLTRVHADQSTGSTITTSSWKKKCGAGESGTTYTISSGTSRRWAIAVECWSGGDPTDVVEDAPAQVTASGASSLGVTGVDPANTGGVCLVLEASRIAAGTTQTFGPPTNYTEQHELQSSHATNPNAAIAISTRVLPDASATGTLTFTVSTADRLNGGSILLKPQSDVLGTAVASSGFTGTAAGTFTNVGTAVASSGFTGTAIGKSTNVGTAVASSGFTATILGPGTVTGTAAGNFGFTGTAAGASTNVGIAAGNFGFTGTIVGSTGGTTTGTAAASFGFSSSILVPTPEPPAAPSYVYLQPLPSPTINYVFGDIRTGRIIAELPGLSGSSIIDSLDDSEMRGTIYFDRTGYDNDIIASATVPGKSFVVVERNGAPIWGGIIWTHTYQSQAKVSQLYAKGFKAYTDRRLLRQDWDQTADQIQIFLDLYAAMQADGSSIKVTLPSFVASGVTKTLTAGFSEYKTYRSLFDSLADADDGFDWRIEVGRVGNVYTWNLRVGYPTLGSPVNHGTVTFDYPGNILNYWRNDTLSDSGNRYYAIGAGEGDTMITSTWFDFDSTNLHGFPRWDLARSFKDINSSVLLSHIAGIDSANRRVPLSVYTVEVKADRSPEFGDYAMGDACRLHIVDPRHPGGMQIVRRIVRWEYYPPTDDHAEMVRLGFEGGDD